MNYLTFTPFVYATLVLPDPCFDTFLRAFTRLYVALYLLTHRIIQIIHQPLDITLASLQRPQWLAELILASNLTLLGLLLHSGVSANALACIMPIPVWCSWLLLHGVSHLIALFWGSHRSRLICSIFEPWVYGTLFFAFLIYSPSPRLAAACLGTSLGVSLVIPFTLREPNERS